MGKLSSFAEAVREYEVLRELEKQEKCDFDRCNEIIGLLKGYLIPRSYLLSSKGSVGESPVEELLLGRSVLESAALLAVRQEDVDAFPRHFAQLSTYYSDFDAKFALPQSSRRMMLVGLYLMFLLATNELPLFHAEVERLTPEEIGHVYVTYAISLEQHMTDGFYLELWSAKDAVPDVLYLFFLRKLLGTAREEIASCLAAAYPSLEMKDLGKLLLIDENSTDDIEQFVKSRGWPTEGSRVILQEKTGDLDVEGLLQTDLLIRNALSYAKTLERIV